MTKETQVKPIRTHSPQRTRCPHHPGRAQEGFRGFRGLRGLVEPGNHRGAGFSLVEIMVVLVIIGLLAGVVTINVRSYLVKGKQNTAKMEIARIVDALETFYSLHDRYPSNEEGLRVLCEGTD